jgi:uncharacterized protein YbjT (DUF2867 family)
VRATGFFWLLDRMLANMVRRPVVVLPTRVRMEPVDSDDFAASVVECLSDGRRGEREDFVGPETLTIRQLAEQYLAAHGRSRPIVPAPIPGRVARALEAASTSPHPRRGSTTWSAWLRTSAGVGASPGLSGAA